MSDTRFYASELARRERYDAELQGLTARIDELTRAMRGTYSDGARERHRLERDRLIADRVTLKQKRKAYLMRSTNPFERGWNLLRAHPLFALFLVFLSVMIPAGPQAIAGYLMIIGTIWFLTSCVRGIKRHYERRIDAKTMQYKDLTGGSDETHLSVPGGILKIKGNVSDARIRAIQHEWEAAQRAGGASIVVLEGKGTQFLPGGLVIPEEVSAMHADDAPFLVDDSVDGVHPPLPAWMRTAWDGALKDYRERVGAEGVKYRDLKEQFADIYHAVIDHEGMIDWTTRRVDPRRGEPLDVSAVQRIERGLAAISPEGARYGELLFRAKRGEDITRYATEDGEIVMRGQKAVASPEMPRSFIPMLDRDFELTTDCRYHHVAEHGLVETVQYPGFVVRTCTICSPATFWIERA
jgi:hypothetical protein